MLIVADENMPLLDEFFADLGDIRRVPGRQMTASDLAGADLLLVRSVTRVDARLLAGSRLRFVGSATIGTDHVDLDRLAGEGIPFSAAPGCNAVAVAEYVVTAILLEREAGRDPGRCLGIVGYGNVGRALLPRARALGLEVMICDPFLAEAPAGAGRLDLDELLAWADIVSLHVPYTTGGPHPTRHLLDARRLAAGRWRLLVNTARGAVIDNAALDAQLAADPSRAAVLDVWEAEPAVPRGLLARVRRGTPHIAGYSQEGKWRGTEMVYRAACRALGITPVHTLAAVLDGRGDRPVAAPGAATPGGLLAACCDLPRDDALLRAQTGDDPAAAAAAFDRLRRDYPPRREFAHYRVSAAAAAQMKTPRAMLAALGFTVG